MSHTPRTDECLGDHPHGNAIEYLSKELEQELNAAQLEITDLKAAISLFCKAHQWADPYWKNQDHIAPLFKIAEKL